MRMVFALFLIAGLGLAGIAVYMAQNQIARYQAERDYLRASQKDAPLLVDVVVAKRPLKYGERFTASDLEVIKVQAGKAPRTVFNRIVAPQGSREAATAVFVEGETRPRATLRSYEVYEPMLAAKVTSPGIDAGITASLAPNMRAFTIQVDVASGVSGFLRPGDVVDVYWSGRSGNVPVTKLIQTNLKLIAIDQSADADRTAETKIARTVTAEVSPEQVAALTLAQSTGRLTLSLVGRSDTTDVGPIEYDSNALLGVEKAAPVAVQREKVCTIRNRKGGEVVEVQIPCTN